MLSKEIKPLFKLRKQVKRLYSLLSSVLQGKKIKEKVEIVFIIFREAFFNLITWGRGCRNDT